MDIMSYIVILLFCTRGVKDLEKQKLNSHSDACFSGEFTVKSTPVNSDKL